MPALPSPAAFRCLRSLLALAALVSSGACALEPTKQAAWPIAVVPAAGDRSGRVTAVPPSCAVAMPADDPARREFWDPTDWAFWRRLSASPWHDPTLGLGCANARNLGHTIEDPRDLLQGRTLAPPDATRQAAAVKRYQEGREKGFSPQTSAAPAAAAPSGGGAPPGGGTGETGAK